MNRPLCWKDHWLLNWRISPRLCIRLMPGLWFPDIFWRRELQYFAVILPFFGITFDYKPTNNGQSIRGKDA